VLLPKRSSVMSRKRGAARQPESLTRFLTSSGAPQAMQVVAPVGLCDPHQEHAIR
jgi:hypothetical protein